MSFFSSLGSLLTTMAGGLDPLFGASAAAAAIVLFTLCVRAAAASPRPCRGAR
ncbi:hypothetical protein ACK1X7_19460 [Streptomyces sp. CY1]|uniref:hypothetical protein n=1 Tax=Streptomyces sp. CY1 TaxID=3388313 RepID=UPI0039A09DEB